MLERPTRNFRPLRSAFGVVVRPLCAVRTALETLAVERLRGKGEPGHLERCRADSHCGALLHAGDWC